MESVLLALAKAIPKDQVSLALASPSAFAASVESCISAGTPPAWFTALPTSIITLLPEVYPQETMTSATPTPTPTPSALQTTTSSAVPGSSSAGVSSSSSSSVRLTPYPTAGVNGSSVVGKPSVSATGVLSVTLAPSGTDVAPAIPTFTGAAAKLSIGAGLGAALGLVGMFAL
ncbi:sas10 utp3 family [Pyrenophora seminiperda CCB06]|uniref:Sas10 utp3 family n=1 Tax=Pyrenophora seminiperda CCB06 TaxID=1302712 RepID=A0A3M7M3Y4_9PLEO|nr:sas10 utp3 family [Pyrenophora seminiperda CCB06]